MGSVLLLFNPMFRTRLLQLRHAQNLTQQALADAVGVHLNQIKRYEGGASQPNLDVVVRLAKALHVSLDELVFDESERGPSDEMALQFEAVSHMSDEERNIIKALLDGMILKHQARRWTGPPTPAEAPGTVGPKPDSKHP